MALGWYWTGALLCVFLSVLAADIMGIFKSKNHFPVEGRVRFPSYTKSRWMVWNDIRIMTRQ